MEILFRAKSIYGNTFVDGCLIKKRFTAFSEWMIRDEKGLESDVITETIGQYVNVEDSDGEKLFVGDLIKCETNDLIYEICTGKGGFLLKSINLKHTTLTPLADERTVEWIKSGCIKIGNIHDNPELLETA